jgi:hypothetical protein
LLPPDRHTEITPWIQFSEKINVTTSTLETFIGENNLNHVDFIHMDVQGAELKVLKGARDWLKKFKVIWMEVADIELYKNQVLRPELEAFMKYNNFYLLKSEMEGNVGDQLYVNSSYYRTFEIFGKRFNFLR